MKLRYVFSAPSMMKLQPTAMSKDDPETYAIFSSIVRDCVTKVKNDVKHSINGAVMEIDILYNAYTESEFGRHIVANQMFGFDKMYADSGGLQIVTQGKTITDELKRKIYRDQCESDFAMCFDEIPTRSMSKVIGASTRSQTSDKLYFHNESAQCAIKTAHNIKEQCDIISDINDKTNVMYIVQGNTHNDMYEWFKHGTGVLTNFDRIGGLALADTCMGNGVLESVDMFIAYNRIRKEFGRELTKSHIHLLGVGSVNRLLPLLWVKDTLLPNDITVSFDSTSFSMAYMMGKFMTPNGKTIRRKDYRKYMVDVVSYFEDIFVKYYPQFDRDVYVDHYIDNIMSTSNTINNAPNGTQYVTQAHITATIMYQLFGFIHQMNAALVDIGSSNSPLKQLQKCTTYEEAVNWRQSYSKYVNSSRIQRAPEIVLDVF